MRLPRDVNGRQLTASLIRSWGYREVNRVGSHIILQTDQPSHHRISVPDHTPLRIGTLNGILRAVAGAKRVTREDIIATL